MDDMAFGQWLFNQPCTFIKSVVNVDGLPGPDLPEVAFAGRSNVGKSSLINGLVNQRQMARASSTPGRTQQLNYFQMAHHLWLVDMPGYGYARASKSDIVTWNQLILDYLKGRVALKRVYLLIDSRHGIKENDLPIMKILDKGGLSYQIVLTKCDKISKTDLDQRLQEMGGEFEKHPALHPHVLITSAEKRESLDDLKASIAALALRPKENHS
jgi:GTP-binding protein